MSFFILFTCLPGGVLILYGEMKLLIDILKFLHPLLLLLNVILKTFAFYVIKNQSKKHFLILWLLLFINSALFINLTKAKTEGQMVENKEKYEGTGLTKRESGL